MPLDRPPKKGVLGRRYFIDRDGYPVLTTDGHPVHFVVDDDTVPVLDEHGHHVLGPVEIPQGARLITGPDHPDPGIPPGSRSISGTGRRAALVVCACEGPLGKSDLDD